MILLLNPDFDLLQAKVQSSFKQWEIISQFCSLVKSFIHKVAIEVLKLHKELSFLEVANYLKKMSDCLYYPYAILVP